MGHIPHMNYIDSQTISTGTVTGGSIPLGYDCPNVVTFHNYWGATLSATVTFEASNDPRAFPGHKDYSSAEWVDVTSHFGTVSNPAGNAGEAIEKGTDLGFDFIRMKVARAAGSGTFESFFSAH